MPSLSKFCNVQLPPSLATEGYSAPVTNEPSIDHRLGATAMWHYIKLYGWIVFRTLLTLSITPFVFVISTRGLHSTAGAVILSLLWLLLSISRAIVHAAFRYYADTSGSSYSLGLIAVKSFLIRTYVASALFILSVALRLLWPAVITGLFALPNVTAFFAARHALRSLPQEAPEDFPPVAPLSADSRRTVIVAALVNAFALWIAIILWWTHTVNWQIAVGIAAIGCIFVAIWIPTQSIRRHRNL
jgi:hypothetical protein